MPEVTLAIVPVFAILRSYLLALQLVLAVIMIVVFLLQVKGTGGGIFGGTETAFRTRRGVEKTLFQFTIVLLVAFVSLSIINVRVGSNAAATQTTPETFPTITAPTPFPFIDITPPPGTPQATGTPAATPEGTPQLTPTSGP